MPNDAGYSGTQGLTSGTDARNAFDFMVRTILGQINTATVVRVVKVTPGGDALALAGTVDVQPLVAQIDGLGNSQPHGVVYGLPYYRIQGGPSAVIMDPRAGDIGFAVFASRDISSVKATRGPALPGSRRQFDMADGIYLGGILNGVPTRYVRFFDDGTELVDPAAIILRAPTITLDGATHTTGAVTGDSTAAYTGDVTANGTSVHTHKHGGVTAGGAQTGAPV